MRAKTALTIIAISFLIVIGFTAFKYFPHSGSIRLMGNFVLKTTSFKEGEAIPAKHTCDGDDVNPMLEIKNVPERTQSLALIIDDPDATRGVPWDHWLMWNINPKTQYIPEDSVPPGAVQGTTSWNHQKYGGPCPPRGSDVKPHRYMFKLYALDIGLDLPISSTKQELEKAMEGHIIEQTTLIGLYGRK